MQGKGIKGNHIYIEVKLNATLHSITTTVCGRLVRHLIGS